MLPTLTLLESHEVQCFQDKKKLKEMEREAVDEFCKMKVWSNMDISSFVTTPAVSHIDKCYGEVENYASLKVNNSRYHVMRSCTEMVSSLIPAFRRTYVVTIKGSLMNCNCFYHECNGLPCFHMTHVLKKHFKGWEGFSKYDVSSFWWTVKLFCSTEVKDHSRKEDLKGKMEELSKTDSQGVFVDHCTLRRNELSYVAGKNSLSEFLTDTVPPELTSLPTTSIKTCINYSEEVINNALSSYGEAAFGLSQECHLASSSDSDVTLDESDASSCFAFTKRQEEHEETYSSLDKNSRAYEVLKSDFAMLCKFIDGDMEQIMHWKEKITEGIGTATGKMNVDNSDSSLEGVGFVSCYKGNGSIKKRKRKRLTTKQYR